MTNPIILITIIKNEDSNILYFFSLKLLIINQIVVMPTVINKDNNGVLVPMVKITNKYVKV